MDTTVNLALPLLMPAQAQKHVTHNEALLALDALVQIAVSRTDLAAPPPAPAEGERFLVAAGGTGDWFGMAGQLATWQGGAWTFHRPHAGWIVYVAADDALRFFDGAAWRPVAGAAPEGAPRWGVNAAADAANRLSVSADASLFSHAGSDHRLKLNKATSTDTATLLMQSGFSGRAEIGLAGSDNLAVKVSTDGNAWRSALTVDAASGRASLPQTELAENLLVNGSFTINQRRFAGGALPAGRYGFDRWKAGDAGAQVAFAGSVVTLASGSLVQVIESALWPEASAGAFVVTVSDLSGGAIEVRLGTGAWAAIAPGTGRRSVSLSAPTTGNLTLSLRPAAASVSFGSVALAAGAEASAVRRRTSDTELRLCQRYFAKSHEPAVAPADGSGGPGASLGVCHSAGTIASQRIALPTQIRAAPALAFFAPNTGQATASGKWQVLGPNINYGNAASLAPAETGTAGFVVGVQIAASLAGSAYLLYGGWTAEAEL